MPPDSVLHGWVLIAVNAGFYLSLCWIAFLLIRNCEGRERLFMVGWGVHFALYPIERLWPETQRMIQSAGAVAWAVSLIVAILLLVHPAPSVDTTAEAA